jgi:hypothetical protein
MPNANREELPKSSLELDDHRGPAPLDLGSSSLPGFGKLSRLRTRAVASTLIELLVVIAMLAFNPIFGA